MARSQHRLQQYAAISKPALLIVACAFFLSACNRQDTPSPPATPKPQTKIERQIAAGLRNAVFSYSVKPDAPYQAEHPITPAHIAVET